MKPPKFLTPAALLLGLAAALPARANDLPDPCWSEAAASNTCAVPNGLPANTLAANLYGVIHEIMGALKRDWDRANPTVTSSGTNTITLTYMIAPTAYVQGDSFSFVAGGTNSGAATLNVNGLGAKAITKRGTGALTGGEILSGEIVNVRYDGTEFQLVSVGSASNLGSPISIANGGTASTTLSAHAVLLGEGANALGTATIGTSGRVLTDNGAGADPTFQAPVLSKPTIATKTSGPYNVQPTDCGTTLIANSGSAITFILPADATAGNGCQIQFKDQGAGVLTIARTGSDTEASGGSTTLTSLALSQGDAGTITGDGVTNGIWWWVGSRHYDSGQQSITSGGSVSLAHGLGVQPSIVNYFFHCTISQGSYSIGDEIQTSAKTHSGGATGQGFDVLLTGSNINIYYGNGSPVFNLITKGGGAEFNMTLADWALVVRAYVNN
jgi:hypothetical protein